MGRQYTRVKIFANSKSLDRIKAFIDTGSDLTIICNKISKRLGIKKHKVEIRWIASDGDERTSPIGSIKIKAKEDKEPISLEDILIDDLPFDEESKEEIILGLDYLQKAKRIIRFDD